MSSSTFELLSGRVLFSNGEPYAFCTCFQRNSVDRLIGWIKQELNVKHVFMQACACDPHIRNTVPFCNSNAIHSCRGCSQSRNDSRDFNKHAGSLVLNSLGVAVLLIITASAYLR